MASLVIESFDAMKEFVGKEFGSSDWLMVSQERIDQFAEATEDRQWIHVDPQRAKNESPFGSTIAHGFLTLSLISCLLKQAMEVRCAARLTVNYGVNRVRFLSPVRSGSRIRGRFTLLSFRELPDAYEAVVACSVEGEGGHKPCCVAEWIVRFYK